MTFYISTIRHTRILLITACFPICTALKRGKMRKERKSVWNVEYKMRGPVCSHAKILSTRKSEKKVASSREVEKSDPRNNVTTRHRDYVKLSVKIQSLLTLLELSNVSFALLVYGTSRFKVRMNMLMSSSIELQTHHMLRHDCELLFEIIGKIWWWKNMKI